MLLTPLLLLTAPAADEVTSLPGYAAKLPSKHYSGFINTTAAGGRPMMVHYLYIEATAEKAETAPTILWTNGGPGASSMFGIFVELGPLLMNENSLMTDEYKKTGVPTLYKNPYSWTNVGSVLMFDWPPPVGFSYCDNNASGSGYSCGDWDDSRMAAVQYAALKGWFDLFPERQKNDLYLTGESYAGIYVPELAREVLKHKDPTVYPQLKGFAVGDGCLGTESGICGGDKPWWHVLFLYGHGQVSNILYDKIIEHCGMTYLKYGGKPVDPTCSKYLGAIGKEAGGYFAYGLYDDCIYQEGLRRRLDDHQTSPAALPSSSPSRRNKQKLPSADTLAMLGFAPNGLPLELGGAVNDYICGGGDAQTIWTNQSVVRKALHVPTDSNFFNGDNGAGMVYKSTEKNLMPFYQEVAKTTKLRVLVYNGDTDPSINSFVAQNWTSHLGFTPTQTWRPWTIDGCLRMGGYVTRYKENFDYLTIRGSGHMVPQFKPAAALAFLQAWVKNVEYKPYVSTCKKPPKEEL